MEFSRISKSSKCILYVFIGCDVMKTVMVIRQCGHFNAITLFSTILHLQDLGQLWIHKFSVYYLRSKMLNKMKQIKMFSSKSICSHLYEGSSIRPKNKLLCCPQVGNLKFWVGRSIYFIFFKFFLLYRSWV